MRPHPTMSRSIHAVNVRLPSVGAVNSAQALEGGAECGMGAGLVRSCTASCAPPGRDEERLCLQSEQLGHGWFGLPKTNPPCFPADRVELWFCTSGPPTGCSQLESADHRDCAPVPDSACGLPSAVTPQRRWTLGPRVAIGALGPLRFTVRPGADYRELRVP